MSKLARSCRPFSSLRSPRHPPARAPSSRFLIIVPAVIFAAIFGLALALTLGALDKRIYLAADLSEAFQFPFTVGIPARRCGFGGGSRVAAFSIGYSRSIDAVITATFLLRKAEDAVLLIAPSEENDQVFDFAWAFASAAARVRRTLLVDLGPARTQKWSLGSRKLERESGAFDVLAGHLLARDAVRTIPGTRLDFVPSGRGYNADTVPLLAGVGLDHLLSEMRTIYDWIIVVSPPVVGGNDARLIARSADTSVLVARSGASLFPDVATAFSDLSSSMALRSRSNASAQIFTVVINAPSRSLPATFRDKRIAKRGTTQIEFPFSLTRAASKGAKKGAAARSRWTGTLSRLVSSRGFEP